MIVALLNQPHGVGKMTLALHPAGLWSYQTRHITVIAADPQGRTLGWSEMRAQERLPRRFTVIGLTRNTLHRAAPNIARDVDRVIVDGPCHIAALTRSALLTVDLVLVPVQLPPFVRAAFAETLRLVNEANTFRPRLRTGIVLNRRDAHDLDAHEISQALAKSDPRVLTSCIGRRAVLAEAVVTGRLAFEMAHSAAAVRKKLRSRPKSKGWRDDDPRSQENVHGARL
jgi:chromosome partitioning protein